MLSLKKEILIIGIIVVFMVSAHIISQKYTQNFFDEITEELNVLEDKILKSDIKKEELEEDIASIQNKWKSKFGILACFIEHDELEKVQTHLISIEADIKVDDYARCIDEADKCKFVLEHIEDKDSFKIVNIF